jgi:8-oxo-dGTP pyrophosphatase MutT (NUDIX family)
MERKKFPAAVHLFLVKNEEILLLKRHNTGYEDGNYSVIAGHLDGNEDVYHAMIREAKEEAGITISIEDLEIVQVMHRYQPGDERIDYFFRCSAWEGAIQNMEPGKCSELTWHPVKNLPGNTIGYIVFAIKNYLDKKNFTLYGW